MSEQVSAELLRAMDNIIENESLISKIDAEIFLRESKNKINEKIAYLFNMIKIEAKNCNQKQDFYFEDINLIITHYKQKLNMVFDEYYCQYANILNERLDANKNRRILMINYQNLVNKSEENVMIDANQKDIIKNKNQIYKNITDLCDFKFEKIKNDFEKMLEKEFIIISKSLQIVSEQNIFQKLFRKFTNIFNGNKRYQEIISDYNKTVNEIDSYEIVQKMREDIVEFIADILSIKGIEEETLVENVRLGGKNG